MQITEELLESIKKDYKNISIVQEGDNFILIFIFGTQEVADTFLKVIKTNEFKIQVLINEATQKYSLKIIFDEYSYLIDTNRTKEKYPPLGWLSQSKINFVAVGTWIDDRNTKVSRNYKSVGNNIILN